MSSYKTMNNLLGIYEKALPQSPWDEQYELASLAGFDFIELSIDANRLNKLDYTNDQIQEIKNAANKYHMSIETLVLSANRYYPLGDKQLRNQGIQIVKKAIILASKLGVKVIQLAAYDVYGKSSTDESKKLYIDALKEILEFNEDYNITLAIEVLEDVPHLNKSKKLVELLSLINHPKLKEYADTGNLVFNGFDPLQDLKDAKNYMVAIHIKDAIYHNEHNIGYGEGEINFDEIFTYLKQINYTGYLVSECWYEKDYVPNLKQINDFIRSKMI